MSHKISNEAIRNSEVADKKFVRLYFQPLFLERAKYNGQTKLKASIPFPIMRHVYIPVLIIKRAHSAKQYDQYIQRKWQRPYTEAKSMK